eukprot:CAMPEP_0174363502 /NCGR_PEP_ID=MMETSP0811_2-20130205/69100_1 /TAXON_ID=73025 ORGANISM="Eutreptiella gymnastica-like, Strain CCMP1594" /NCGR_SAMPLE_ID=MMETSP0811_2 /ASSEMBLY_ACC=CAM_ASM_000667 /LENGTH=56 /DNA_ID=CAMNT_0015502255 /DNA_START=71 /DNA_END=238 /DNA_ORIENTATION=-
MRRGSERSSAEDQHPMATTQRKHTRAWNGWSCLLSIRKDKRHMENPLVTDYARTLL